MTAFWGHAIGRLPPTAHRSNNRLQQVADGGGQEQNYQQEIMAGWLLVSASLVG